MVMVWPAPTKLNNDINGEVYAREEYSLIWSKIDDDLDL